MIFQFKYSQTAALSRHYISGVLGGLTRVKFVTINRFLCSVLAGRTNSIETLSSGLTVLNSALVS